MIQVTHSALADADCEVFIARDDSRREPLCTFDVEANRTSLVVPVVDFDSAYVDAIDEFVSDCGLTATATYTVGDFFVPRKGIGKDHLFKILRDPTYTTVRFSVVFETPQHGVKLFGVETVDSQRILDPNASSGFARFFLDDPHELDIVGMAVAGDPSIDRVTFTEAVAELKFEVAHWLSTPLGASLRSNASIDHGLGRAITNAD